MSRVATNATAPNVTSSAQPQQRESEEPQYPVKWVLKEQNVSHPIVMQSANGPCALLALANALLVTGNLILPPGTTVLSQSHLMSLLAEHASSQPSPSENYEHLLQEFLELLPSLSDGLHINVIFSGASAFEFTKELSAFDVLKVRLLHGWLVDPQDGPLCAAISPLSYNQVINELVRTEIPEAQEASAPPEEAFDDEEPVVEESQATNSIRELRPAVLEYFAANPTMLTVYGLANLHEAMKEGETAVLFRNSHFYVLRKKGGELYTLVTDVGYLNELNTVWEKLSDITGDSTFYTGRFHRIAADGSVVGGQTSSPSAFNRPDAPARAASAVQVPHARTGPAQAPQPVLVNYSGCSSTTTPGRASAAALNTRRNSTQRRNSEKCIIQ